jgi:hypothetical protein
LKFKRYILFILVVAFATPSVTAQKTMKKKDARHLMDSLFNYVKKASYNTRDSIITHSYNKNAFGNDANLETYIDTSSHGSVLEMLVIDGDTSYIYNMQTFAVVDLKPYGIPEKDKLFRKLRYHVKKVYPYAKVAANKLNMYEKQLQGVKSNSKRRKIMKKREKALKEEFEDVIKTMSKTSGRVLIKLIDRETGQSTYEIIKEMRGGFKAWTYQGIGKFYGADLKQRFDPKTNEEDEMIERVVQSLIAEGTIFY